MKVISFCLWGNSPKYTVGALRNIEIALELFPDWICRFYVGTSVSRETVDKICSGVRHQKYSCNKDGRIIGGGGQKDHCVEIFNMPYEGDWRMMFDRFLPMCEDNVEVMISRDCDSRLSQREKDAVDEWLESDKSFHCMRDHPWHNVAVLGGMWGAKRGFLPNFEELLCNAIRENRWQTDQDFLNGTIWSLVKNDAMQHDSFYSYVWDGKPFPSPRNGSEFVGEIFNEFEQPNIEHRRMVR